MIKGTTETQRHRENTPKLSVSVSLWFIFLAALLLPSASAAPPPLVTDVTASDDESAYKVIRLEFSTVEGGVLEYQIYFANASFTSIETAQLHSRVRVTNATTGLPRPGPGIALDDCWFMPPGANWTSAYRDLNGTPVILETSTAVRYDLPGMNVNTTYWFGVVAVGPSGEAITEGLTTDTGVTSAVDVRPPGLDTRPVQLAIWLIVVGLVGLFGALYWRERKSEHRYGYLYTLPALIALAVLTFYPVLCGFYYSFTDSNTQALGDEKLVGLDNYVDIFTSKGFLRVTATTFLWTLSNVTAHVCIGLAMALVLQRQVRGKRVYRTLLLLPWAIPSLISVLVWRGMFEPYGLVNDLLGTQGHDFLATTGSALAVVILVNVWLGFPFMMMVFSGALQSMPKELYEAAEVEGLSKWQQFRHITLPLLKPTAIPVSLLGFIWTFNMFNVIYLMTAGGPVVEIGGPGGTDILITYVYDLAFPGGFYGLAAAWSVVIFLMLIGFSALYTKLSKATEAVT